ncbi:MAG: Hsp20/alpha crystallin family protein [Chitinispirillaceae bacterium]|jgi:HSP20 family protein|nr:Hsp20/alpha crystallin family protein [Chitinispirillaceae bacterium]
MALIRYEGNPIATLFDELENMWSGGLDLPGRELAGRSFPKVDITESDKGYQITADLPGLKKEEIKVSVEENTLTISGEKKREVEKKTDRYFHFERSFGSFSRSFTLPANVDSKNIEARYSNGVLELNLMKTEETKPKAIEVKVG